MTKQEFIDLNLHVGQEVLLKWKTEKNLLQRFTVVSLQAPITKITEIKLTTKKHKVVVYINSLNYKSVFQLFPIPTATSLYR